MLLFTRQYQQSPTSRKSTYSMSISVSISELRKMPVDAPIPVFNDENLLCSDVYNTVWEQRFDGKMMPLKEAFTEEIEQIAELVAALTLDRWSNELQVGMVNELRTRIDKIYKTNHIMMDDFVSIKSDEDHSKIDKAFQPKLLFSQFLGNTAKEIVNEINSSIFVDSIEEIWGQNSNISNRTMQATAYDRMHKEVKWKLEEKFKKELGVRAYLIGNLDLLSDSIYLADELITPIIPDDLVEAIKQEPNEYGAVFVETANKIYREKDWKESKAPFWQENNQCIIIDDNVLSSWRNPHELALLLYTCDLIKKSDKHGTIYLIQKSPGSTYERYAHQIVDALDSEVLTFCGKSDYSVDGIEELPQNSSTQTVNLNDQQYEQLRHERMLKRFECKYPDIFELTQSNKFVPRTQYCGEWINNVIDQTININLQKEFVNVESLFIPFYIDFSVFESEEETTFNEEDFEEWLQENIASDVSDFALLSKEEKKERYELNYILNNMLTSETQKRSNIIHDRLGDFTKKYNKQIISYFSFGLVKQADIEQLINSDILYSFDGKTILFDTFKEYINNNLPKDNYNARLIKNLQFMKDLYNKKELETILNSFKKELYDLSLLDEDDKETNIETVMQKYFQKVNEYAKQETIDLKVELYKSGIPKEDILA